MQRQRNELVPIADVFSRVAPRIVRVEGCHRNEFACGSAWWPLARFSQSHIPVPEPRGHNP